MKLADTLFAAGADMTRIHRRVVRVGATAAWCAAAVLLVAGFVSGVDAMFIQSIGPILVAGFMTAQIVLGREDGVLALLASALVTVGMYGAAGTEETLIPASVGLVVIASIGMLLVERFHWQSIAVVAVLLFLTPHVWSLGHGETLMLGGIMTMGFVMTAAIFTTVRNAAANLNLRFQMLFSNSPTAVMEEDWSEALAYVRSEYTGRPDRIRPFLLAYPAVVRRAVSMARVLRVNQAAVELMGAEDPYQLLGNRSESIVTEETLAPFVEALVALYEGDSTFEQEILTRTRDGKPVWLQARCVDTSLGRAGSTVLVGLANISHLKERQHAMAELVRAKDEFIAKVSHELRTPLTAVLGLTSELNSSDTMSEEERAELMSLVGEQAAEMSYIVEDLLIAARAEMGTVPIDSTIVDLHEELKATVESVGIAIDEYPDQVPRVIADANRVRQILRNLLTNAMRYGGPTRRVLAGISDDGVWMEVRDDGTGVPEELLPRLFEPYAAGRLGAKGSMGLGLSVAKQLADLMNGSLSYSRESGETVFRLALPLAEELRPILTSN